MMIERVSSSLRNLLSRLQYSLDNLHRSLEPVRNIYAVIDTHEAKLKAEESRLQYPSWGRRDCSGMEVEFRCVFQSNLV